MSAPKSESETKDESHKTPLIGMGASVLWALVLLVLLVGYLMFKGQGPGDETSESPAEAPPAAATSE